LLDNLLRHHGLHLPASSAPLGVESNDHQRVLRLLQVIYQLLDARDIDDLVLVLCGPLALAVLRNGMEEARARA
jgi:hypothetical protein